MLDNLEKEIHDHLGNKYKNIREMCKYYKVAYPTYHNRLQHGWSLEEALLGKPVRTKRPNDWTDKEIQLVKNYYKKHGYHIPGLNRTKSAIQAKAEQLGLRIKNKNKWTNSEIEILKENYPKYGSNIKGLNHDKDSIRHKAQQLGLNHKHTTWTEEENRLLKENYEACGTNISGINKSKRAIQCRASLFGLQKQRNEWTEAELDSLKKNYSQYGGNIKNINRPAAHIRAKAALLGLKNNQPLLWTEEEDLLLKKYYKTRKYDIPELHKTNRQIYRRAHKLGLKTDIPSKNQDWTTDEDKILLEKYPTQGTDIPELNRSRSSISQRARKKWKLKYIGDDSRKKWYNNKCGLKIRLLKRTSVSPLRYEYEFEDGEKVITTRCFSTIYSISHPSLKAGNLGQRGTYKGFNTKYLYTDKTNYTAFYECECYKCGYKDVHTPQQMMEHFQEHEKAND